MAAQTKLRETITPLATIRGLSVLRFLFGLDEQAGPEPQKVSDYAIKEQKQQ